MERWEEALKAIYEEINLRPYNNIPYIISEINIVLVDVLDYIPFLQGGSKLSDDNAQKEVLDIIKYLLDKKMLVCKTYGKLPVLELTKNGKKYVESKLI
jgi:Na+-transporting NADH:ubiquinone oxidoreductase subunit NqrA